MKKIGLIFGYTTIVSLVLLSCKPDIMIPEKIDLSKGVFIINEGNFMSNNGEIGFYDPNNGKMVNHLFALQNNEAVLGDIVQSMCISDSLGLIVVNNSKKLEIVNINTFKHIQIISGLSYPRYIIPIRDNICYLSNGYNPGQILVINTLNFKITDTINVGNEPENLILYGNKVFVANGAWGHDSTVSVIDAQSDQLLQTLNIGDGATDLVIDKLNRVWVLCQGKTEFENPMDTPSKLVCFNTENYEIIYSIEIGNTGDLFYPVRIAVNPEKDRIYYIEKEGVFSMNILLPETQELLIPGNFYGMEIHPQNGDIYVFSNAGFNGSGSLSIYNSKGEKMIQNIETGIGPNGAVFN
jgi:DNA-binding beta-propeller fold protein YncE